MNPKPVFESQWHRWYTAYDDPVALMRAENRTKTPWMLLQIDRHFGHRNIRLLDVGCGPGFVSNALAAQGVKEISALDINPDCLEVARFWNTTGRVTYLAGDAYHIPLPCKSFDAVAAMGLLEHLEHPEAALQEFARILKDGGLFLYQTTNRNIVSDTVGTKFARWFLHQKPLQRPGEQLPFLRPGDLDRHCRAAGFKMGRTIGLRPKLATIPFQSWWKRLVPESLEFKLSSFRMLSYMGTAVLEGKKKDWLSQEGEQTALQTA